MDAARHRRDDQPARVPRRLRPGCGHPRGVPRRHGRRRRSPQRRVHLRERRRGRRRRGSRHRPGRRGRLRAGQPQRRHGLRGRLAARVRVRTAEHADRRRLLRHVHDPAGHLRVQDRDQRHLGRELRRGRCARRLQRHVHGHRRRPAAGHVRLRPPLTTPSPPRRRVRCSPCPARRTASSAARATGTRPAWPPSCSTRTATAWPPSRPTTCRPAPTRSRSRTTCRGRRTTAPVAPRDGANIVFSAPGGKPVTFSYVLATHVLTIDVDRPAAGRHRAAGRALGRRRDDRLAGRVRVDRCGPCLADLAAVVLGHGVHSPSPTARSPVPTVTR